MTGGQLAAIIVSVAMVLLVAGLLVAFASLVRTLKLLRTTIDEFRREALPLVADMKGTVAQANAELVKVDELLDTAGSISTTLDAGSRLAYLAFSNPLVKALALGAGTSRAVRRFRRPRA
ncbi:MAG TPA: DUF948 domain-containing protein [Acidimicrobiales bacterium]|nr:DUF948 domain-containing protein [Acidimicrobiales bacterium]